MKYLLVLFAALILVATANAQDKPEFKSKFGGTVQAMASYSQTNTDTTQIGFGLRRVRVKMYGTYGDFLKSFVQFELTTPKLLDARIEYIVSKAFQIRVGRFIGAGVRAAGLTSHTDIDIVERPASAIYWGRHSIGADYRDYGVAFLGTTEGFGYNLTIHNGDGALNIKASHFGLSSIQNESVAVSGMVFYKPPKLKGFEVGGYYGIGNEYENDYSSYNGYVYFEPLPYRLKVEIISLTDKNGTADMTALGYYGFGAFRFADNFEALARVEILDPNTDVDNDKQTLITLGLGYAFFPSSWKTVKITGAYVIRQEEGTSIDNDVFYILFQAAL